MKGVGGLQYEASNVVADTFVCSGPTWYNGTVGQVAGERPFAIERSRPSLLLADWK